MFKVNNKDTRTTSIVVNFEQVNFSWVIEIKRNFGME